jgi:hypothetical protein
VCFLEGTAGQQCAKLVLMPRRRRSRRSGRGAQGGLERGQRPGAECVAEVGSFGRVPVSRSAGCRCGTRGSIQHRPPLRVGGQLLDALAYPLAQGCDLTLGGVGRFPLRRSQRPPSAPLPPCRSDCCSCRLPRCWLWCWWVIWTPRNWNGSRYGRNCGIGVLPPIPPARPAQSSAQGPGATAGDDRTKTASAAPEGRKDLGPVGRRRRGRPLR